MRFSAAIQSPLVPDRLPVDRPSALGASAASMPFDATPVPLKLEELGELDQRVRQSGEW